ncbi:hypothetical protein Ancab_009440 [Ancistrocladus abbreviatus]
MAFYNGVEHGASSGRSVSEKGMPASPSSPPVQTHGRDGKDQECSSAPISSEHRQPTEALNGTTMRLDATDRSVGSSSKAVTVASRAEEYAGRSNHINEKICLCDGKNREGSILSGAGLHGMGLGGEGTYLGQMGCHGLAGMLEETRDLGIGEGVGLDIVPSQNHQGSGKKEGLGLDVGPFQLQSETRTSLGNTGSQKTEGVERGNKPCLSQQPSPKGSGDSRRDQDLSSSDGSPSRGTLRKQKKASQKKRKKRKPRLRIAVRSSPMQAEDHPLNVPRQGEITLSGICDVARP